MIVNDGLKDEDHDVSEPNYNLAPGNHGLVYLAHKCKKPHEDALERMDTVVTPGEIHQYQIRYKLQVIMILLSFSVLSFLKSSRP